MPSLKFTMKHGLVIEMTDFHIKDNTVFDKNSRHASLLEIDYNRNK